MPELSNRQKLIAQLIQRHDRPTVTVLMKLAFLLDLIARKKEQDVYFGYVYRRYTYGPFDEAIYHDLKALIDDGVAIATTEYTSDGKEYIVYNFNEEPTDTDFSITEVQEAMFNEIMESLKGYGAKALTDIAYKTAPMQALGATLGGNEHINEVLNLEA